MASKWVVTCDKCGVSDDKPVYRPDDGKTGRIFVRDAVATTQL